MSAPPFGQVSQKHHRDQPGLRRKNAALALAAGLFAMLLALPAAARAEPLRVVALGDSLTAGYALPPAAAFPVVLEAALKERGHNVVIANAGVSGDTASGGLARLDWSVPEGTRAVILELGANDMLRGVDPAVTEKALDTIVGRLRQRGIAVLLAGMRAAPNLGEDYARRFAQIYTGLAEKHHLVLYPFFLDGVAGDSAHVMPDGLHPNAAGVEVIVARILPTVERFLAGVTAAP